MCTACRFDAPHFAWRARIIPACIRQHPHRRTRKQTCVYFRSLCTRLSRSSSESMSSIAAMARSRVDSPVIIITTASETPSSSARRMTLSWLGRSIVANVFIRMRMTGCCRISASSDGVKYLVCCLLFIPAYASLQWRVHCRKLEM